MTNLFPTLLSEQTEPELAELDLFIGDDIHYFKGHFPQAPVLAGVSQLHWVVHYTQHYFPGLEQVLSVEVLKFQVMIRPGNHLKLILEKIKPDVTVFSYLQNGQKVASGRLKWAQTNA